MNRNTEQIGDTFGRVVSKLIDEQKRPRDYGTGEILHYSEVATLLCISSSPGVSVTSLADQTGVTKGAVSQTLSRLDKKGMIVRREDPSNLSRINLELTNKGEQAVKNYASFYKRSDLALTRFLNGLDGSEKRLLRKFFAAVEKGIDNRL